MFEQQKNAVWASVDADLSEDEVHEKVGTAKRCLFIANAFSSE